MTDPKNAVDTISSGPTWRYRWPLQAYAMLFVLATFVLVGVGGHVTSRGAGLDVPDWPGTFGYNMFTVPLHKWIGQGGVFWEHFHRLLGSFVGLLAIGMCIWTAVVYRASRPWLVLFASGVLILIIIQGLMGGFRVTEESLLLAFVHGVNGQIILGMIVFMAVAVGRVWLRFSSARRRENAADGPFTALRILAVAFIVMILVQLLLGAGVRHTGSAQAIPDFPTHYGQWLPPLTPLSLDAAVERMPPQAMSRTDFSVGQVTVHFYHRVGAVLVCLMAGFLVAGVVHKAPRQPELAAPVITVVSLLFMQFMLGVSVVLSEVYPDLATAHQLMGAVLLAAAVWLAVRIYLVTHFELLPPRRDADQATRRTENRPAPTLKGQPA